MIMHDKVAVVTGAATGLGRETALAFARAGACTLLADIMIAEAEEAAHQICAAGGEALATRVDVSSADDVEKMVATAVAEFGRLDYAFNNAGIAPRGAPIAEMSEADWGRAMAVNLTGVWLCLKYECAQLLRQGGGGAIVNTSSTMGVVSGPGLAAYSASKSGVLGLTRAVALDYARNGIRVNAVCPGGIGGTAITDRAENKADMDRLAQMTPLGRLGVPREIADTVVWLCSDQASYITGQALTVDGGFTIW
ncbi:MAG: glucose 1-dehydrogenase [Proteobacteria bacterium]|nr:glucose 1-dehydrogenase [Pseudomonadota bacterium]